MQCLEPLGSLWTRLLEIPHNTCLIGIRPTIFLLIVPFIAIAILFTKRLYTIERRLSALALLTIVTFAYCMFATQSIPFCQTIACNNGDVTIFYAHNQLALIDPGVIGQKVSAGSWVQYTLLPSIIKTVGRTSIEHVIILQPNKMIFEALEQLSTIANVKKVYIPYWENKLSAPAWHSFCQMQRTLEKNGTIIIRYGRSKVIIELDSIHYITIDPMDKKINKLPITYSAYCVTAHDADQVTTLYSKAFKPGKSIKIDYLPRKVVAKLPLPK